MDDMMLGDSAVSHLKHADDMVIISHSPSGLQWHLDKLQSWCYDNFLSINPSKSQIMMFSDLHSMLPHDTIPHDPIAIITGACSHRLITPKFTIHGQQL
ncbi:hypothetical protein D9758_012687 [Tetrapyrgos nigripes]|uniref:Reverse transcriptase domain-containing protein n=1 Tax=Tetrapyrgos nigripes TaxID=182062 RepID=A0A8H5CW53_9AGAR|nr:hypothetical protein D9758_012687 [Tetrapyrgos nigripes]